MPRLLSCLAAVLCLLAAPVAWAVTVEKVVSPGGIEAWLVQDHANPILALDFSIEGGAALDPAGKEGLAAMLAGLLDEGAGPHDSQTFQGLLDDHAIQLGFEAGLDGFGGKLKTLTRERDLAFSLLRLALTAPRFDAEPVERIRSQLLSGLAREAQSPEATAARHWYQSAFPGHPYGRSKRGTPASVKAIAVADLKALVKTQLTRGGLRIGVAGDITPEQLKPLLDSTFGPLPASPRPAIPETRVAAAGETLVIARDNPQSVAVFGLAGVKRDDPDWYAAYVMNYILGGGGFSSWLTEEVREKRGLAYSVYSYLAPLRHAGLILGGVATENARLGESLALIRAQMARMRDEGPQPDDLADARTYLTGSFALQLDSTDAIAALLVAMQRDNLGLDFLDRRNSLIEAVTLKDIRRVAKRLLDPQSLRVVVVGAPQGLK